MPLVSGTGDDERAILASRIANTRKLLCAAAAIMSVLLIGSAIVTTTLIPAAELREGGQADGRALAYLAHRDFGEWFGTLYDVSTIAILWFAGASAMAGLLNLVPRYLPRYGMAPDWARARRPLVMLITAIGFVVTYVFDADVNQQGGAYATGVLVLMTSAAIAVTIARPRHRGFFVGVSLVFVYTTLVNIYERPEGIQIAGWFIAVIIVASLVSRVLRSTEIRIEAVAYDEMAARFVQQAAQGDEHSHHRESARITATRTSMPASSGRRNIRITCPTRNTSCSSKCGRAMSPSSRHVLEVTGATVGGFRVLRCVESGDPERHCGPAARPARPDRLHSACLLRLDGGQPDRLPAEIPRVRRRRYRAGLPRGAAQGRARSGAPAAHSRRMTGPGRAGADQSALSVVAGSTRSARRMGIAVASRAATMRTAATAR